MEKSRRVHRWVRGGTGFLLGMGMVLGGPAPMPSVLSVFQGGVAHGQESTDGKESKSTGSGVAAEDPCPPVKRGAFSLCRSQQENEKSGGGETDAGQEEEDPGMLKGLKSVGGGLAITTLGVAILNNLDFLSTDCSGLSEEVDPDTG